MAFGAAATPTNNVRAWNALYKATLAAGYTPDAGLGFNGIRAGILANLLTTFPGMKVRTATVDFPNVPTISTAEGDCTVTGVAATDVVIKVMAPSTLDTGLWIADFRVKAADTITVRLANTTAGDINPGSATWTFVTITP